LAHKICTGRISTNKQKSGGPSPATLGKAPSLTHAGAFQNADADIKKSGVKALLSLGQVDARVQLALRRRGLA
jgi:hypothetical protein